LNERDAKFASGSCKIDGSTSAANDSIENRNVFTVIFERNRLVQRNGFPKAKLNAMGQQEETLGGESSPSINEIADKKVILRRDNAAIRTAASIKIRFPSLAIELLPWPASSGFFH
jgi:hypothetical protein